MAALLLVIDDAGATATAADAAALGHDVGESTGAAGSRRGGKTRPLGFELALLLGLLRLTNATLFFLSSEALGGSPGFLFRTNRREVSFFLAAGFFLDGEALVAGLDQGAVFRSLEFRFWAG